MASIFTKIVAGEIPCHKIAENDEFLAFLDISPLVKGHTLVIPKTEIDYILDVEDMMHARLWNFAKRVGKAIEQIVPCKKIGITVIGLEVAHAHIHLIPINSIYDMDFSREKLIISQEDLADLANKINLEFKA
jgi:histidine triad (HIT) family protein